MAELLKCGWLVTGIIYSENVQEHAPPLAGASVETGIRVHDTGDVDDKAASGGCCVSSCSASFESRWVWINIKTLTFDFPEDREVGS